jgi:Pectate lyase superfamily protein
MPVEIFANQPSTTVAAGQSAVAQGTTQTWTVASSLEFPAASSTATPPTQFHVADTAAGYTSELIAVTNVSGTSWTVTRGAEGTAPIAHLANFTITQVITAGVLGAFAVTGSDLSGAPAEVVSIGGAVTSGHYARGTGSGLALSAIQAGDLPAATTSAQGAVELDGTAGDIQALASSAAAGGSSKAAAANHVHPNTGLVTGVTAGDTSIVVGGTSQAPTIETATLDVIATQHPAAASVPMNSKKFTGLANGSASGDSAAYGQTPAGGNTATVGQGGTGATSLTAYAPLAGGTTGSGAVQSASTGMSTSGYVLTSNGSSSLPSFQAVTATTLDGVAVSGTPSAAQVLMATSSSAGTWVPREFNVMAFGATGNGTTDDTAAIQAAINACGAAGGGTVFFPPGTYACASALTVTYSYVTLRGPGYGFSAVLAYKPGTTRTAAVVFGTTALLQSCNVIDLSIDAGASGALQSGSGHGIVFRVNNGTMQNVIVQYTYEDAFHIALDGEFSATMYDVTMSNCYAQYPGANGLYIDANVENSEFTTCKFVGGNTLETPTGTYGINCLGNEIKFLNSHCYFWPSGGAIFGLDEASAPAVISIIGGEYETNGGAGITMTGVNGAKIVGADCYANTGADITLTNGTEWVEIGESVLTSPVARAIYLSQCTNINIHDNVLTSASTTSGVQIDTSSPVTSLVMIHGNVIASSTSGSGSVYLNNCTHCDVYGNILAYGAAEASSANYNRVYGNIVNAGSVTMTGASSYAWGNSSGSSPLPAVYGGTGVTSLTGYEVLAANSGGTAVTQVSGTGTSGQVLTSQGSSTLPHWANVTATTLDGVTVSGTPSAGQVLTASSSSAGTWQHAPVDWINAVTAYGADPTGGSPSTTAIQSALTAAAAAGGGTVYLPAGTYLVSNITIDSYVTLRGAGRATLLQGISGSSGYMIALTHPTTTQLVVVQDLALQPDTGTLGGIQLDNSGYGTGTDPSHTLSDIYVMYAGGDAFHFDNDARALRLSRLRQEGAGGYGFYLGSGPGSDGRGCTDSFFVSCESGPSGGHGFCLVGGWNCMFTACKSFYSGYTGTWGTTECNFEITSGCFNTAFVGCSAQNGALHGFDLQGCQQITVTGCEIDSCSSGDGVTTGVGINTNGATNCTIAANTGYTGGQVQPYGLQVNGTQTGTVFTMNTVEGATGQFNYAGGSGYLLLSASTIDLGGVGYLKLPSPVLSNDSVQTLSTGSTINTASDGNYGAVPVTAAVNVTGLILQAPSSGFTQITVINQSAYTMTFAASGTSHVADGTLDVIPALTSRAFVYDGNTSLWYRAA